MIDIRDISGNLILEAPLTKGAVAAESLMAHDYMELSWESTENTALPVGAYITVGTEKYRLLEPYSPEQKDELQYSYRPKFQSRTSAWAKVPLFFYTYSKDGTAIEGREPDWTYTDTALRLMQYMAKAIYEETGELWSVEVASDLAGVKTLSFASTDILSGLGQIADAFETEWHADKTTNILRLGRIMLDSGYVPTLEVGVNIKAPSVTKNKEGYYNRFYVFGSTRNITQDYKGADVNNLVNKRLTLDPAVYPEGCIDRRKSPAEPAMTKILTFDGIYPKSSLVVVEARPRLMYVTKDGTSEKIQIGTDADGNPIYDQYSIWYVQLGIKNADGSVKPFRLANKETYSKDNPDGVLIPGKALSIHFNGGLLAEREFEVDYKEKSKTETNSDGAPFDVKEGDFEILYIKEGDFIIPSMTGAVPMEGDKAVLFNLRMPDEYISGAYKELEGEAEKAIAEYESDRDNYQFSSNHIAFKDDEALQNLRVGQKVIYVNGGYSYETRIINIEKKLDFPWEQTITIGNERIKGDRQTLREDVANANKDINIIASFNSLTQATINGYDRAIQNMLDGFSRISRIWQFDPNRENTIFTSFDVYSLGAISAKGMADGGAGDDGSGEASYDRYDGDWSDYTPVFDPWVVSGKSGKALLDRIKALESGGIKPGDIPTLHTLTIKLNGATVGTFNPSADKTINIADVASASALSAHVSDATVHVTATERAKWNKVVSDFSAITGADADTVINKWEEVVAFLDSYTEADTLAGLLSHKADKATTLAGYGITDAYTKTQTDTKLSQKLDKSVFDTFKSEFDSMFEKEPDGNGGWRIKAKYGLYSVSFITAKGINGTQEGGDGSGEAGASYDRLDEWADYSADRAGDVLSAKLGWDLHTRLRNCYAKTEADSRFQPKGDYLTQHQSLAHLLRVDGANGTWAGVSALIGKLSDATAVIEDATLLVTSHVDPSSTSMYYRRPASALWDYVKSKADALYQPKGNYLTAITKAQVEAVLTGVITTHVHQRLVSSNATDLDTLKGTQFQVNYGGGGNTHAGRPSGTDAYGVLSFQSATGWYTQILRSSNTNNGLFVRDFNGSAWTAWDRILTAGNYPSVLDGRYVNATGDTMSGPLTVPRVNISGTSYSSAYITSDNARNAYINIKDRTLMTWDEAGDSIRPGTAYSNVFSLGTSAYRWANVYATTINVTSQALVSNLNADLLDGKHRTEILRYDGMPASAMSLDDRVVNNGIDIFSWDYATNSNVSAKPPEYASSGAASVVSFGGAYPFQICSDYNDTNRLYYRSYYGSKGWKAWRRFAFVDSNVASATKLADDTAYTAWGRTFFENGKPKSVSGDMTGVGSLSASGEIRTSSQNAFRAVRGGYGFLVRNDGGHTFFLFTDKGNELGGWNGLRPLYINNATGRVTMGNGLSVGEAEVATLKIGSVTISYDSVNEALKISGGGLYSESFITAKGISSTSAGSDGGGSDFGLMKTWPTANPGIGTMDALGANLGWELYAKASANASSISSLSSRITALEGKNYLDALTLAQSGTGNAVTSVSLSADKKTLTVVKGTTFLTSHQSLANYYTKTETRNNFARALYSNDVLNGDMNTMLNNNTFLGSINATANTPNGNGWYNVIQVAHRNGAGDGSDFVGQIALGMTVNHERMYFRTHRTRAWQTVLTTANYAGALDSRYVTLGTEQTITGAKTFGSDCFKVIANVSNYVRVLRSTNTAIPTSDRDYAWQFYHWASAGENRGLSIWSYDGDNKIFNHVATFKAVPSNSLVVNGAIVKSGGTASQFLMADGSVTGKASATTVSSLGWSDRAVDGLRIPDMNMLAYWNGAYNSENSNLAYCYRGRFGDIVTQSLASLDSRYVNVSGDTMTGDLNFSVAGTGVKVKSKNSVSNGIWGHAADNPATNAIGSTDLSNLVIGSHWGVAFTTTCSNQTYTSKVAVGIDTRNGNMAAGGYVKASYFTANTTTLCTNLNADLLDGKHLGNTAGCVVQWTSFPTFASLVTQGYLAEAVQNDNQEYFKALLKWICANYTGEVQLIGKAAPNSQGMLTIHIYDCSNVQGGLPQHSSAVYEAYAGGVTAFGTMSYAWQWNNGTWNGSAVKLLTARTLWGRPFDGTASVKGSIASDYFSLNDVAGNPYLRLTKDSFDWYVQAYDTKIYLGAGINRSLSVDRDGHVGIGYGTANPTCPLDVNGDIRAMGWLRFGTWGRVGYADGIGWLQMAQNVTNRITAINATEMTRLEIKSAMTAFSGQITNSNSAGNSTTIAYGAIELSHATPYIDFHFGRTAEDFDVRLINDEAGVLHLVGGSLKLGNGYIRWDSSRGCFAFSHGIYSESFITAKAVGSTTADASVSDDKEIGGAIKVQSDEPEESELEALRLRVAQLEQRINALTA